MLFTHLRWWRCVLYVFSFGYATLICVGTGFLSRAHTEYRSFVPMYACTGACVYEYILFLSCHFSRILQNLNQFICSLSLSLSVCLSGICPVNRNSINYLLSRSGSGNAVVIVVGGAAESLDCAPGMNSVTLKNRKGFVKLALQQG